MFVADLCRHDRKPIVERHDLPLFHRCRNREGVRCRGLTHDPAVDFGDRDRWDNEFIRITNGSLKVTTVWSADEELDPSGRINYDRHLSPSLSKVLVKPFRNPRRDSMGLTGTISILPSSWITSTLSPGDKASPSRTSLGMTT